MDWDSIFFSAGAGTRGKPVGQSGAARFAGCSSGVSDAGEVDVLDHLFFIAA